MGVDGRPVYVGGDYGIADLVQEDPDLSAARFLYLAAAAKGHMGAEEALLELEGRKTEVRPFVLPEIKPHKKDPLSDFKPFQ